MRHKMGLKSLSLVEDVDMTKSKVKDNANSNDKSDERRYGDKSYWDNRYDELQLGKDTDQTSEWLISYEHLEPLLTPKLRQGKKSSLLDVGCGISCFLVDMCVLGRHTGHLVGIDISGIDAAKEVNKDHPNISIMNVDARECSKKFGEQSFDAVLDKSTIDGMLCDEVNGFSNVTQMAKNIGVILKEGGVYCVVSHNQPQIDEHGGVSISAWLEAVMDGLIEHGRTYHLDIHVSGDDDDNFPSVYLFTRTRRSRRKEADKVAIEIKLHEH